MTIVILDYKMGNLRSLSNAVEYLGHNFLVTSDPDQVRTADKILIPGVGNFMKGMQYLNELDLTAVLIEKVLVEKTPVLGICLGMQLLMKSGTEGGNTGGLGFFDGTVEEMISNSPECRVPFYGWAPLNILKDDSKALNGISDSMDFYFVHSYSVKTERQYITSTYQFGQENIVSSIEKNGIWGTQFHPEKSKIQGLTVLKNFLEYHE